MLEVAIPAFMVPSFRTDQAVKAGVERNIMLRTWGGIGDQICAEPTLRFALETFKGCTISLASERPEFFQHLKFDRVFDLKDNQPLWEKYLTFDMIRSPEDLTWEFLSHMIVNCVDYPSLCAFRCMLPVEKKRVRLAPSDADYLKVRTLVHDSFDGLIAIHAGRHWQSKTFPVEWWQEVTNHIIDCGRIPVLIGGETDDNRGTVPIVLAEEDGYDLRGKLTMMETVALLKRAPVLLTNDSAPLPMAVDSGAWIGFIATCKHPDYIMHWRKGGWAWRMQNHGKGGIWDVLDYCPNKENKVEAENVGDELLRSWLPDPKEYAQWAIEKTHQLEQ